MHPTNVLWNSEGARPGEKQTSHWTGDHGFDKGCQEMADQLSCDAALLENGIGYDYSGGTYASRAVQEYPAVYVEFIEPLVIGPLGPWSLLYPGTELSASSDFSKFSPYIPFVSNF